MGDVDLLTRVCKTPSPFPPRKNKSRGSEPFVFTWSPPQPGEEPGSHGVVYTVFFEMYIAHYK